MDSNRWQQIEEIFQAALDLSPAEREKFVDEQTSGDAGLGDEVRRLIADYDSAESFIESPVWTDSQFLNSSAKNEIEGSLDEKLRSDERVDVMIGKRIGVYELKKEIGRGGMGAVYLAERADGEFRQKVAVKLIKRGMDTDFVLSRFRHERQILANLNHSNIVLLLDGGSTDDGLPYFVMDFVEGEPLQKYSRRKNLNVRQRVELFLQVCEAVDYAHQKKIVHRDLKPSNILVNKYGMPKLLDFGIAKLLDPDSATDTLAPTETHMRLMTPEYASPEQISGAQITPASDIYSLGVLLYELVTGTRPYQFTTRAPHEIARIVCEEEPIKPSAAAAKDESRNAQGEVPDDENQINEDLDKIVLKALRKNSFERYETAAALAADLRLYLEDRPVKAKFYQPAKKIKANGRETDLSIAILPFKFFGAPESEITGGDEYLGVGLADSLIMRLSGVKRLIVRPTTSVLRFGRNEDLFQTGRELGVDFVVTGNIRRAGERIRVKVQLLKVTDEAITWAENYNENFTDVLELEDSISEKVAISLLPYLTGEERRRLEKRGTNSPEAYEAFLRGRFNWNLHSEEAFARAIGFYRRAVEIDPNYALAYTAIAEYYIFLGIHCVIPFIDGAKFANEAAEKAVRLDPSLAEAHAIMGFVEISYNWNWEAAEKHFRRAIELNPNSVTGHNWLNSVLAQAHRFDEALEEIQRILELDPDSLLSLHLQAWTLYHARRFSESIEVHRKMLRGEPNYAWGLQTLSWVLRRTGQYDEAVAQAARAVQLTGENPFYLTNLAANYAAAGNRPEAEKILARLDEIAKTRFVSEYTLALVYCALGDRDQAFENLEKSLATRDGWLNWLGVDPQFDVLRGDERYEDLLRRTGSPLAKRKEKVKPSDPTTGSEKSIAVLPLKLFAAPDTGGSHEDEYLGVGLADALVTRLSNVRRLVVRPTSSVLPFEGTQINPFQAGRELNVDYILDGNIRRAGDRIRVTVQLLNVGDKSSRWAESFNELFTDVLEVEDSISEKVVKCLIPRLTGEEAQQLSKRGTSNAEAYEAYLRGRYHWNQFTPDALFKAQKSFQTAIAIAPDYALAHVGLADFYIWANIYGLIPSAEALPLARQAARRAIELDDQLGEAYASLGLTYQNQCDWARSEELYKKSLELAPNYVHAHEFYGAQMVGYGNIEAGVREIKIAERLDPLSLRTKTLTAWTLYQAHFFDEALERARQIVDLDPNYPQGYSQIGNNLLQMGKVEEAIANFQKFNQMIPNSALAKYTLCNAYAVAGRTEEAGRVLGEIKTLAAEAYVKPYFLGAAHASLNQLDEAFANFEKAYIENDPWMLWFGTEPILRPLRGDRRYADLLGRMGVPLQESPPVQKLPPAGSGGIKSIAVLPLKFIGAAVEEDDEYLAVGLADAMITRLSNVRRLMVRPTSSVLKFREAEDSFSAGRQLGVDVILAGTIRRAGTRLRISTQLLDVKTESTLWAENFDEEFTDVLELEDLVAEKVAKLLIERLTGEEEQRLSKRGTSNAEAYEAYLRGRYYWNQFSLEGFSRSYTFYRRAVEIAPDYALAHTGLADYYNFLGVYTVKPFAETSAVAKEYALKAIALDPLLAEAYASLGFATLMRDFDWGSAEKHLRRALDLNPNYVLGRVWYCYLLGMQKKFDEAFEQINYALKLDSQTPLVPQTLNWTLYYARRYEESIAATRRLIEREPQYGLSHIFLSLALSTVGEFDEASKMAQKAVQLIGKSPYTLLWLASSYAAGGRQDRVSELLGELAEMSRTRYVSPYLTAMVHSNSRDKERAFTELERALAIRDARLVWLAVDPPFDFLKKDLRFNELLRRTGNPLA